MGKQWDSWYPLCLACVVGILTFFMAGNLVLPKSVKELVTAALTISSISVGFLATAKSILLSMEDNRTIRALKDIGEYKTLVQYLMSSIHVSFIWSIVSGLCLLADFDNLTALHTKIFSIWVFSAFYALLTYYRVIRLFSAILSNSNE